MRVFWIFRSVAHEPAQGLESLCKHEKGPEMGTISGAMTTNALLPSSSVVTLE
jgi:hypothetical protein